MLAITGSSTASVVGHWGLVLSSSSACMLLLLLLLCPAGPEPIEALDSPQGV
jgi:hypothetical protein